MDPYHKIVWSEGMLLTPHHFQHWDRYYDATLMERFQALSPFGWGVGELDIDIVLHPSGTAASWATDLAVGTEVAVSGPGRGYEADPDAEAFLLIGDESAIPAICQLLETLPDVPIVVHIEIVDPAAREDLHREVCKFANVLKAKGLAIFPNRPWP